MLPALFFEYNCLYKFVMAAAKLGFLCFDVYIDCPEHIRFRTFAAGDFAISEAGSS